MKDLFLTTRWTVVLKAGRQEDAESSQALAELCQTYWFPLYAYVRRRGHGREDAEDLTQAFFERFLRKNYLQGLEAERGRFRAFLLAAMNHFLANEWDRARRLKRGGGAPHLSLEWDVAHQRYHGGGWDELSVSPECAYDRAWAVTLLEGVLNKLEAEYVASGRARFFETARACLLPGAESQPQRALAEQVGMDEAAFRMAVSRLRRRYRECLREEIAATVSDPDRVEDEFQSLRAALVP